MAVRIEVGRERHHPQAVNRGPCRTRPVVLAAMRALAAGDPALALHYVKPDAEDEVVRAYELACAARSANAAARALAERFFSEAVVRLHRAGEGAPDTGLKPAGLGFGPVVPGRRRARSIRRPRRGRLPARPSWGRHSEAHPEPVPCRMESEARDRPPTLMPRVMRCGARGHRAT